MASSSAKTVQISSGSASSFAPCDLHLMPFHINYTGPAAISTYFRLREAPPQPGETPEALANNLADSLKVTSMDKEEEGADVNTTKHAGQPTDTTPNDEKSTLPTPHRLTAAFRGRTVQGVRVDLPPGYSGLLLRAPGDVSSAPLQPPAPTKPVPAPKAKGKAAADKAKKAAAAAQAKARRAARRSGKREAPAVEVDEEEQEQPEEEAPVEPDQPAPELVEASSHAEPGPVENEEGQGEIRTLVPSATFSSFVLWNADVPVDAGKDEYLRTLTEWVGLAAEMHR